MVGGISALIGAAMLGPRIGKFVKDKAGKVTKVNAFPGHNLPIGALGVSFCGLAGTVSTVLLQPPLKSSAPSLLLQPSLPPLQPLLP